MSDRDNILDVDFDAQMQGLFQQAERAIGQRNAPAPKPSNDEDGVPELVETLDQPEGAGGAIELRQPSDAEAPAEITGAIRDLDAVSRRIGESVQSLPKAVSDLRALLEMKNGVSHSMFSALHEELKGYKDGFLLQSVYRPIIRDLVSVYDDLTEILRQITEAIAEGSSERDDSTAAKKVLSRMRTMEMNLGHNVEFILEVLARLEVTQLPCGEGKLDKCRQRAVAVEATDDPEDDTLVLRIVKRGFLWHERVLRPEEVVVKRYKKNSRTESAKAGSAEESN
jgi:molecular chaperone GrpE (heat shock protein)